MEKRPGHTGSVRPTYGFSHIALHSTQGAAFPGRADDVIACIRQPLPNGEQRRHLAHPSDPNNLLPPYYAQTDTLFDALDQLPW